MQADRKKSRLHLVKRLLEAVGHPVVALRRIRFGPLDRRVERTEQRDA